MHAETGYDIKTKKNRRIRTLFFFLNRKKWYRFKILRVSLLNAYTAKYGKLFGAFTKMLNIIILNETFNDLSCK